MEKLPNLWAWKRLLFFRSTRTSGKLEAKKNPRTVCLGELRNKPGLTFDATGCEKIGMLISSQNWVVYINPTKLQTIRGPFLFAFLKWNKWNSTLTALAPDIALAIPALFFPLLVSIGMDHPANSIVFIKALCCKQLGPLRDSAYTWHSKMKEGIFMKASIGFSRKEAKNFQQRGDTIFSHFWKSAKGWNPCKKTCGERKKKSGQMASDGKWWQWFETTPEMVISIIITMASLPCSLLARPERCPAPCSPGHLEKATNRVMLSPENSSPNKYPWFSLGLFVFFFTPEVTVPGFKGPRVCFFWGKKTGFLVAT